MRVHRAATRLAGAAAALVAAVALALAPAAPAAAHTRLISATPAADAAVPQVAEVSLAFDQDLVDLGSTALTVTDPAGRHYETACATVADETASAPVALGDAGTYTVSWRVVSGDGHPVSGVYEFESTVAAPGPGTAEGPGCASPPDPAAPAAGVPTVVIVAAGVSALALVGVVVGALVLVLRLRRAERGAAAPPGP